MSDDILSSIDNGVLTLRLSRPDKKNAITIAMYAALAKALQDGAEDDAIRAVRLLTSKMADAVLEGKQGEQELEAVEEPNEEQPDETDAGEEQPTA